MITNIKDGCRMVRGTYIGDGTVDRAIPHGLGATPILVMVMNITSSGHIQIDITGTTVGLNGANTTVHNVTPSNNTNFYVGMAGSAGWWGNDLDDTLIWYAFC